MKVVTENYLIFQMALGGEPLLDTEVLLDSDPDDRRGTQ